MKLNRKQLRKLIIQEAKNISEATDNKAAGIWDLATTIRDMAIQRGLKYSPYSDFTVLGNFGDEIATLLEREGPEAAFKKYMEHHDQL